MSTSDLLAVVARNRRGECAGLPAWCTAHPETLRAVLRAHSGDDGPILIEATCNQVNQHGGYTGLTPAGFRDLVVNLAREVGTDARRIVLGGDHLGPNPWRHLRAGQALAEAAAMIKAYAEAGYAKIHLDASMRCADDPPLLSETEMAERAARLCAIAEETASAPPLYVIGTEVPSPGGETEPHAALEVTTPEDVRRSLAIHREAFRARGLERAVDRVFAIVAQPGVDFSNTGVHRFDPALAKPLKDEVTSLGGPVYEAHSTDYQSLSALTGLVKSHFAILKVGPELTFAYREAVVAMALIEQHSAPSSPSRVLATIDAVLEADASHWKDYVSLGEEPRLGRLFGLSDRIRYYWPHASIASALGALTASVDRATLPVGLVSQFAGLAPSALRSDRPLSQQIIEAKIGAVVARYREACGIPSNAATTAA
jgi:D-tagatose-bisphosphate aldolase class II non-catalytic subunit